MAATKTASTDATTSFDSMAYQLQQLAAKHQLKERHASNRSRNKLQPRHMVEFPTDSIFHKFARCVCQVGVIPWKELFETWAMALYVHQQFPKAERIADLACSHGLLSWALLLLASDKTSQETTTACEESTKSNFRSVVCIDLAMPRSAEAIADVMLKEWPDLQGQWDYIEGPLEALEPDPSSLLVGIHTCGSLSDKLITLAIEGQSCLALVPCCHSKKCLTMDQKEAWNNNIGGMYTLPEVVDNHRMQQLSSAGYQVVEAEIPPVVTPKNRIILATPPASSMMTKTANTIPVPSSRRLAVTRKENLSWAMPSFKIPMANTAQARATVRSLAGRDASLARGQDPPIAMCVSLFLPPHHLQLSADELSLALPDSLAKDTVAAVCPEPFWHAQAQRHVRTFQVTYPQGVTKAQAKQYHKALRGAIPDRIVGTQVRY